MKKLVVLSMTSNSNAMYQNNLAYMTAQINELKRDLRICRDQLRGYEEEHVPQDWIDSKIEEIGDLNESIHKQASERDIYRESGGKADSAVNHGDSSDSESDVE